jgi:uncharacterized membrane protein YfcA
MTAAVIAVIVLFSLLASFVQRVSGFGFGIIIMAVLPLLMPSYGEATALSGLLAIVTSMITAIRMRHFLTWKKLLPILLTFLIVSFFSVKFVTRVDSHLLRKVLGAVLIFVSIYFFFVSGRIHARPTIPLQIGMGTLSGVMGGLFAMQGPPAVIYFISSADTKEEYTALTQWYFFIGNVMITLFRAGNGLVTADVGRAACFGVIGVLAGLWIGSRVYGLIKIELLRKIVYSFLAISGIIALVS